MASVVIRLKNCAFFARHGVLEAEAVLGQRFFVDAELTVDAGGALESDEVADTLHYGDAYQRVASVVTTRRFNLIEALAYAIGTDLMTHFPRITAAAITVRKPAVPIDGILDHAEVTVILP